MAAIPFHIQVPASARPSALQRNVLLDLSSAVGLGTALALVAALLPSMARHQGLGAVGLALLAATPFAASLLSIASGRIGPRTPAGLAIVRALGSLVLILVVAIPGPQIIVVATFVFWATFALGQPLQQRLWAAMYPANRRGSLLGIVGTGRFAAGTVALLAVTLLIDGTAGRFIIVAVAIIGGLSALATAGLTLPASEPQRSFGVRDALGVLGRRPMLRRVAVAQLFYGAGIIAAAPLIAMVHVDRLGLGLEGIALAGLTVYAATTVAFGPWGHVATRLGGLGSISVGAGLGAVALVLMAGAPNLLWVLVAAAVLGMASAAINVSWPLILAEHAPIEEQAALAGGLGTIMGARGLVAPFLLMVPLSLGLIGVAGGLLVCAVLSGTGALLYARLAGYRLHISRPVARARTLSAALGALGVLIRL